MKEKITYIFRKPNTKYYSIESLFHNISNRVANHYKIDILKLEFSGGDFKSLWLNLKNFKREDNNIYHITGDVHYMAMVTGKKSVLTIHDIKSALQGNFFKKFFIRLLWFWLPALLVKRITVISNFTKNELKSIIPFAKSKIHVIHNSVNSNFKFDPYLFRSEKPHILFMGTKSNKNLERSFEAIKDMSCKAIIIGKLNEAQINLLDQLKLDYENKFNLTFEEIVSCYKHCDLVCFASTYEGFGMPIIEAQVTGRPVITSDFGAMKEVSNNSALEVNPYDVESIKQGVLKICNDGPFRTQLITNGLENIKRFQPDYIANQYIELYKEILS